MRWSHPLVVDAFAEAFPTAAAARAVLTRAGVPETDIPSFSGAREFWTGVLDWIARGGGPKGVTGGLHAAVLHELPNAHELHELVAGLSGRAPGVGATSEHRGAPSVVPLRVLDSGQLQAMLEVVQAERVSRLGLESWGPGGERRRLDGWVGETPVVRVVEAWEALGPWPRDIDGAPMAARVDLIKADGRLFPVDLAKRLGELDLDPGDCIRVAPRSAHVREVLDLARLRRR